MIDSPTVLPTDEYFPDEYDGSDDSVRSLLEGVCHYMHVSQHLVDVEFFSESNRPGFVNEHGHAIGGTAGLYEEGSRYTIHLERAQVAGNR